MAHQTLRRGLQFGIAVAMAVCVLRLSSALARYRVAEATFADLALEAMQPAQPIVENLPESPRPDLTLWLRGGPLKELHDAQIAWSQLSFTEGYFLSAYDKSRLFRKRQPGEWKLECEFPRDPNRHGRIFGGGITRNLWNAVIATVGEFPVVEFWDASTGQLIQSISDEHPTMSAHPDASGRHKSGLRYSETAARKIVASPTSGLFAIGKMDGTIELWGDLAYRDHPEWLRCDVSGVPLLTDDAKRNEALKATIKAHDEAMRRPPTERQFGLLSRRKVHVGEVVDLRFCEGGLKLLSIGGLHVTGYETQKGPDGPQTDYKFPVRSQEMVCDVALSSVESLDLAESWRHKLESVPSHLAVPPFESSRSPAWIDATYKRKVSRPFAIAYVFSEIQLASLSDRKLTDKLQFPAGGPSVMTQSLTFHRDQDALLSLHTHYRPDKDRPNQHIPETVLTLWHVGSKQRMSTARLDGQVMSAGWDSMGFQLALLRFDHRLAQQSTVNWPWESSPQRAHMFHLWDIRVEKK